MVAGKLNHIIWEILGGTESAKGFAGALQGKEKRNMNGYGMAMYIKNKNISSLNPEKSSSQPALHAHTLLAEVLKMCVMLT